MIKAKIPYLRIEEKASSKINLSSEVSYWSTSFINQTVCVINSSIMIMISALLFVVSLYVTLINKLNNFLFVE